jgi:methionyl-tRNA synthetase
MPPLAPSLRLLLRRARSSGDWICQSCLRRYSSSPARASSASSPTTTKPYYVTTPIFYVNAAPHVGHLYSMLVADVLKRFAVLRGRRAFLLTGTDEHGMKVQRAAERAGVSPQELCDANADIFRSLADAANVSYDYFARTSEHGHKAAVQSAWALLNASGFIYSSKHEGWYSMSDEVYFPDSKVELALDPMTGKKRPVSRLWKCLRC